jgi:hypothetical protein
VFSNVHDKFAVPSGLVSARRTVKMNFTSVCSNVSPKGAFFSSLERAEGTLMAARWQSTFFVRSSRTNFAGAR